LKTPLKRYEDPSRRDWVIGFVVIFVYLSAIAGGAFLLLLEYWYVWLILVIGGLCLIVGWHTKSYAYRCRECGSEFEIDFITNLFAPHGIDKDGAWEWLKCPNCQKRRKADVIKIVKPD
jgi:DNA-directed RNA polymerase subunit RPC12/RpoP